MDCSLCSWIAFANEIVVIASGLLLVAAARIELAGLGSLAKDPKSRPNNALVLTHRVQQAPFMPRSGSLLFVTLPIAVSPAVTPNPARCRN